MANTTNDVEFQETTISRSGQPIMSTATWSGPGGRARFESFTPNGVPVVDEVLEASGRMSVIDYGLHTWWTTSDRLVFTATNPFGIANDLSSGQLHIVGVRTIDADRVLLLSGTPIRMLGSTVDVTVDAGSYLPVSVTAYEPGNQVGVTTFRWLPATERNMAVLGGPAIPTSFSESAPPAVGAPSQSG